MFQKGQKIPIKNDEDSHLVAGIVLNMYIFGFDSLFGILCLGFSSLLEFGIYAHQATVSDLNDLSLYRLPNGFRFRMNLEFFINVFYMTADRIQADKTLFGNRFVAHPVDQVF